MAVRRKGLLLLRERCHIALFRMLVSPHIGITTLCRRTAEAVRKAKEVARLIAAEIGTVGARRKEDDLTVLLAAELGTGVQRL